MWVELSTGMGRVSLEGMFVMPYGPCGVPITLIHSHSDFPTRSYRYDLASVARHSMAPRRGSKSFLSRSNVQKSNGKLTKRAVLVRIYVSPRA